MPHLLIVDDEPDASDFVSRFLQRHGHTTVCAPNGREALAVLVNRLPDAIILDVRMPQMDGITLLEIMRSYLRWQKLPVVLLTAHATPEQLDKARQLGASAVFEKAKFKLVDLLETLRTLIPPTTATGTPSA